MNDAQQAAQVAAAAGAGGKAAATTAAKYTALSLIFGMVAVASVVMAATTPDKKRDVFVCLMTTAMASVCGGAVASVYFGYVDDIVMAVLASNDARIIVAAASMIGLAFCCGLPAWCVAGGVFVWFKRMRGKTIVEIIAEAKSAWK